MALIEIDGLPFLIASVTNYKQTPIICDALWWCFGNLRLHVRVAFGAGPWGDAIRAAQLYLGRALRGPFQGAPALVAADVADWDGIHMIVYNIYI